MDINTQAPATAATEAVIAAPIESVWDLLTSLDTWLLWNSRIGRIRVNGPPEKGTIFEWSTRGMNIASRFEQVDRPKRLVWSSTSVGMRGIQVWELRQVRGTTRICTAISCEGPLPRVFPGLLKKILSKMVIQNLADLKAEVERLRRP